MSKYVLLLYIVEVNNYGFNIINTYYNIYCSNYICSISS